MIKLGSHVSFNAPKYLVSAIETSLNNGANCAMIYLGAPQNTKRVAVEKYNYAEYLQKYSQLIPPKDIIVHAPYIVNPSNPEKQDFAVQFLVDEIFRMDKINLKYLVLHPGAFTKYDADSALKTLTITLKKILEATKNTKVEIILETMSGKGSEVGRTLNQLKLVMENLRSTRMGICLDTCHLWDAGYNLKNYDEFIKNLEQLDVLKYVKVIHLNDSKNPLGASKDRHENIDKGFIGAKTLAKFVHDKRFDNIAIILETPIPESGPIYDREISLLLGMKS